MGEPRLTPSVLTFWATPFEAPRMALSRACAAALALLHIFNALLAQTDALSLSSLFTLDSQLLTACGVHPSANSDYHYVGDLNAPATDTATNIQDGAYAATDITDDEYDVKPGVAAIVDASISGNPIRINDEYGQSPSIMQQYADSSYTT